MKRYVSLLLLFYSLILPARIYHVSGADEINRHSFSAGDTIVLRNGIWMDQHIRFRGSGTQEQPVVLMARTAGDVQLRGNSLLVIEGEYLLVSGLDFNSSRRADSHKSVVEFARGSAYCRLTETRIVDYNSPSAADDVKWISLRGCGHRVDHCTVSDKKNMGVTVAVWLDEEVCGDHRMDHNYFGPRVSQLDPLTGKELNGQETIRVGDSRTSLKAARCTVEDNLFDRCNGEIEVISNKSCGNLYRNNLFLECVGTLCLRHGHDCVVEGNVFLGNHAITATGESGGVRVMGEGHRVVNNYFHRIAGESYRAALSLTKGNENLILNRYSQVKNTYVAHNTFVDCVVALDIAVGHAPDQPEPPVESRVEYNCIYNTSSSTHAVVYLRDARSDVLFRSNGYNRGDFPKCGKSIKDGFSKIVLPSRKQAGDLPGLDLSGMDDELFSFLQSRRVLAKNRKKSAENQSFTAADCGVSRKKEWQIPGPHTAGVSWATKDMP